MATTAAPAEAAAAAAAAAQGSEGGAGQQAQTAGGSQAAAAAAQAPRKPKPPARDGWSVEWSGEYSEWYWWNPETKQSTWTDPGAPAATAPAAAGGAAATAGAGAGDVVTDMRVVGMFPKHMTAQEMGAYFAQYGKVVNVQTAQDTYGTTMTATYENQDAAANAAMALPEFLSQKWSGPANGVPKAAS